ncbi:hypothetical protein [Delftia tsuruhatensis]|uniref:hypothetical protein n=1 Tax=Delftia tsuruhatensis TaxID=180282 RepID=UPI0030D28579
MENLFNAYARHITETRYWLQIPDVRRPALSRMPEGGALGADFEGERLRGSGAEGRRRLQAKHRSVVGGYHGRVTVVNMHQVTNLNNRYKNFFTFDSYNASFF